MYTMSDLVDYATEVRHMSSDKSDLFLAEALFINPSKSAGIYASHRFRGAYTRKVCIDRNFLDRFSSVFALDFPLALKSTIQNVKVKIELEEKLKQKKWKNRFS